jgi:squalene-hopene/tetraprenyl-beta-curcumene cyclase
MRSYFVAAAAFLAGCSLVQRSANTPVQKAARYLWSQQKDDGGWHSHTYGLLKSGQSLTPFVLNTLLQVPESEWPTPQDKVQAALAFMKKNTDAEGALGRMDALVPDYPNYATALAVQALVQARMPSWQETIAPMVARLRAMQFTEESGWKREDPAYGAWGMGADRRTPPNAGQLDLSMTRHVLQALAAAGVTPADPALVKAAVFVERCQNYDPANPGDLDGGFFFSTVVLAKNKGGYEGQHPRSYGTTTADGILSLLAIGRTRDHARVRAAQKWLTSHHQPSGTPGLAAAPDQRWIAGLRFYYAGASAEAYQALGLPKPSNDMLTLQRADGSWANSEIIVKEDDPLIATTLALRSLLGK